MSDYNPVGKFLVLSDYNGHNAKKSLLQVHSRHLHDARLAKDWAEFIKDTDLKGRAHKHKRMFVMQIVEVIEPES